MTDQVNNQPYVFQCAWLTGPWTSEYSVISYDRLFFDEMSGGNKQFRIKQTLILQLKHFYQMN